MKLPTLLTTVLLLAAPAAARSQEPEKLYSGPQPGEPLPACPVLRVPGDATREHDFAAPVAEEPVFLVFVHQRTRPALGLVRLLTAWAADRAKDAEGVPRLSTRVVWLDDDRSGARAYLTSDRTKLDLGVPLGIAVDGGEGPGTYGLNREVVLTILLASGGEVVSNFALDAPSDTDAPVVLGAVARALGEEPPTSEELAAYRVRYEADPMSAMAGTDRALRREVARLRPSRLTPEEVAAIARAVDELVADDPALQRDLGIIAAAAISRRDFEKLGTEAARAQLRAWAAEYGKRDAGGRR